MSQLAVHFFPTKADYTDLGLADKRDKGVKDIGKGVILLKCSVMSVYVIKWDEIKCIFNSSFKGQNISF